MTNTYQLTLDRDAFVKEVWQQQPKVIRQAFKDFVDPIAADELAGLACEDEISSRVVLTKGQDWEVISGPFEDYDKFGEENWQLLVQAVNHWYPDSQGLVEAFRFLPDWRFDDLMVSFATPGGGVGPHIDNYDVFIIQGEGRRRWTVGAKGQYAKRGNNPNTPLIEDFEPIIDTVLEPGDMLYIPPGFPHRGETLTLALSYSIGFRAPSQQELISEMADFMLDQDLGHKRFTSSEEAGQPALIAKSQQQGMMALLKELTENPDYYQGVLGKLLSQNRFELDICQGEPMSTEELREAAAEGAVFKRIGGLKILILEEDPNCRLFINGEAFELPQGSEKQALLIANHTSISGEDLESLLQDDAVALLLCELLEKGYCYLSDEE
ncbi:cupin domain-containing protein [Shewanella algae]|uniref:ribosomal protein uL16 3-hydroxylase n=1 Tax=Shewanella algae TaxID=38313 RepID=UPI001AAF28DB|nr:cupin domain-containing protein [Shewanella algae]MBO2591276.1 cupin domain-containing protein [Shewanella algae]